MGVMSFRRRRRRRRRRAVFSNVHSESLFMFSFPNHDNVLSLMTSLKTNSPVIPLNHITLNLLRSLSPYFIGLIAEIIHRSLISCFTLNEILIDYSDLKKTNLDQSNLSSYRPISLLLSISNN